MTLKDLLIGSEGSLGVITAAVLKVDIPPGDSMSVLASIGSPADAVDLFRQAKERLGNSVSVFELIRGTGFDFLREVRPDVRLPLPDADWLVLAEFADVTGTDLQGRAEGFMFAEIEAGRIVDAVVAQSMAQQRELRSLREMIPEANRQIGAIASHDISVPISRVSEFIAKGMKSRNDLALFESTVSGMSETGIFISTYFLRTGADPKNSPGCKGAERPSRNTSMNLPTGAMVPFPRNTGSAG